MVWPFTSRRTTDQQTNLNFLMRAWADDNGSPGEELGENYLFHQPAYFTDGADVFAYYEYDDPIPVDGTVYVGMVQEADFSLNIGLDKNTDYNFTRPLPVGLGAEWTLSTIEGTVMIRPVLQAGRGRCLRGRGRPVQCTRGLALSAWPNPAGCAHAGVVRNGPPERWSLVDLSGRTLDTGSWPQGMNRFLCWPWRICRGDGARRHRDADGTRTTQNCNVVPLLMTEELPEEALPDGDELFEHHRIAS